MASGYRVVGAGALFWVALSVALVHLLSTPLFGVDRLRPATFGGVILVLAAVAGIDTYMPARAVMSIEPLVAMRENRGQAAKIRHLASDTDTASLCAPSPTITAG